MSEDRSKQLAALAAFVVAANTKLSTTDYVLGIKFGNETFFVALLNIVTKARVVAFDLRYQTVDVAALEQVNSVITSVVKNLVGTVALCDYLCSNVLQRLIADSASKGYCVEVAPANGLKISNGWQGTASYLRNDNSDFSRIRHLMNKVSGAQNAY